MATETLWKDEGVEGRGKKKERLTATGSSLHCRSNDDNYTTDEHTPAPSVSVCEPSNRGEGGDLSQLVFAPLV